MALSCKFGGSLAALRTRRRSRGSARPDGGAVAVEAALIIPMMVMMFAGVIEYGTMFRHGLAVSNAARQGARTAAQVGTTADADFRIVQSTLGSRGSLSTSEINAIIVYKADAANGDIPTECITALNSGANGVAGVCNVYRRTNGFLGPVDPMPWAPSSRLNDLYSGREFIGVYVDTTFDSPLHLTINNRTVSDRVVFQFDPGSDQPMTIGGTLPPVETTTTAPTTTSAPTTTTTRASTTTAPSTTTTRATTTTAAPTTTTTRPTTTTTRATTTTTRATTTTTRATTTTTRATTTTTRPTTTTTRATTTTTRPTTTTTRATTTTTRATTTTTRATTTTTRATTTTTRATTTTTRATTTTTRATTTTTRATTTTTAPTTTTTRATTTTAAPTTTTTRATTTTTRATTTTFGGGIF